MQPIAPIQSDHDDQVDFQLDQMERQTFDIGIGPVDATVETFREAQLTNLGEMAGSFFGYDNGASGEMMKPEEVADMFDGLKVKEAMTWGEANTRWERIRNVKEARELADMVDSDKFGSTLLPFAGGLAGNLWDAETIGLGFAAAAAAPFLPGVAGLAAVTTPAFAAFIGASTLEVLLEEALYHNQYEDLMGEEYTLADSAMNAAAAFTLGGIFEFGPSSLKKLYNKSPAFDRAGIAQHVAVKRAFGQPLDLAGYEKYIMEDKFKGASKTKTPSTSIDDLKRKPIYGVRTIEEPKSAKDYSDMDMNSSYEGVVFTNDMEMATSHASNVKGTTSKYTIDPEAKIIDLDNTTPELLAEVVEIVSEGDGLTKKRLEGYTVQDIIDELNTPTKDAELNARRSAKLDEIQAHIEGQSDGTKKVGGKVHGEDYDGAYAHDAVTIHNPDVLHKVGDVPSVETNMVHPKKLKGQDYIDSLNRRADPELDADMKQMAEEFDDLETKAPDTMDEDSMDAYEKNVAEKHDENASALEVLIEDMAAKKIKPKLVEALRLKLDEMKTKQSQWTEGAHEKYKKGKEDYNICKLTDGN